MFIKLTEADTGVETYFNEHHIVKIIPNAGGTGSIVYLTPIIPGHNEPNVVVVHENADEVVRIMGRMGGHR